MGAIFPGYHGPGIPELSGRWRAQVAGSGETAWKPMRKSRLSRPRNWGSAGGPLMVLTRRPAGLGLGEPRKLWGDNYQMASSRSFWVKKLWMCWGGLGAWWFEGPCSENLTWQLVNHRSLLGDGRRNFLYKMHPHETQFSIGATRTERERYSDRHTDRQTDRHIDRQTDRPTDRQTYWHTNIHTDRHTDRHTDIQYKSNTIEYKYKCNTVQYKYKCNTVQYKYKYNTVQYNTLHYIHTYFILEAHVFFLMLGWDCWIMLDPIQIGCPKKGGHPAAVCYSMLAWLMQEYYGEAGTLTFTTPEPMADAGTTRTVWFFWGFSDIDHLWSLACHHRNAMIRYNVPHYLWWLFPFVWQNPHVTRLWLNRFSACALPRPSLPEVFISRV